MREGCLAVVAFGLTVGVLGGVEALLLRWAWNAFAVPALHVGAISFVQAVGLAVLLSLLTGIFRRS